MAVAPFRFYICFCAAVVSKALGREKSVLVEHERASGIASVCGNGSGDGHEVGHSRTSCANIPGSLGTPPYQGRGKAFGSKNRVRMLLTGSFCTFFDWFVSTDKSKAIQRSLDSDGTDYATYERTVDVRTLESYPVKFTAIGYLTLMVSSMEMLL